MSNLHHRQNSGPSDHIRSAPQAPGLGDYVTFVAGQFAGRTIRVELTELQKAESGRKYAKVDRRPLDPPPAVQLHLYEAAGGTPGSGNQWEHELSYENVLNVGLMCTVDLFPVPEDMYGANSPAQPSPRTPPYGPYLTPPYTGAPNSSGYVQNHTSLTYFPLHPYTSSDASGSGQADASTSQFQIPRRQPMLAHLHPNDRPQDAVHQIGRHLITESSKLTPALVGERFTEPTLVDYQGRKALIFVFGDLAVRREGVFILRYRAFDIFSNVPETPHKPVLAELYGGAFKVYSTREFPGLEPSTELTRTLSKYGVRVTLRDAEGRSKKRNKGTGSDDYE